MIFVAPLIRSENIASTAVRQSAGYTQMQRTKRLALGGTMLAVTSSSLLYLNAVLQLLWDVKGSIFTRSPWLNVFVFGVSLDSILNDIGMIIASEALLHLGTATRAARKKVAQAGKKKRARKSPKIATGPALQNIGGPVREKNAKIDRVRLHSDDCGAMQRLASGPARGGNSSSIILHDESSSVAITIAGGELSDMAYMSNMSSSDGELPTNDHAGGYRAARTHSSPAPTCAGSSSAKVLSKHSSPAPCINSSSGKAPSNPKSK
jgi:hypothetical protein